jgi:hypothetical protein
LLRFYSVGDEEITMEHGLKDIDRGTQMYSEEALLEAYLGESPITGSFLSSL